MRSYDPIRNVRVFTECMLHPGLPCEIIVPLLHGKAFPVNRCENAAGYSSVCMQCAESVNARAELLFRSLPDHLKP